MGVGDEMAIVSLFVRRWGSLNIRHCFWSSHTTSEYCEQGFSAVRKQNEVEKSRKFSDQSAHGALWTRSEMMSQS